MRPKKRIGIIGVGFMGEYHIQAFQQVAGADLVAVADVNAARLAEMRVRYQIPTVYADYRAMLQQEQLDGVVIATPDHLHRAPVEAVAAAGLPVFLEKPIATEPEDAAAIIGAVERAGVRAVVGFDLRWTEPYIALKERVARGELGTVHTAYTARRLKISSARRYNGRCSVNEYVGCHEFDFLLWVLGTDVESIYASRTDFRVHAESGVADSYLNLIKWKNGAGAAVLITWGTPESYPRLEDEFVFIGTKGYADKDRDHGVRFITDQALERVPPEPGAYGFVAQAQGFVDLIAGRAEPKATLLDALRAQQLVWAAEESARTGRPVAVDLQRTAP